MAKDQSPIRLSVGDRITFGTLSTEVFVVNRLTPTHNQGIPVRLQIDCIELEEIHRRRDSLTGLLMQAGELSE